jgi:hypothetical protein
MLAPHPTLWKESYESAVRESDIQKLAALVHAAEEAIFFRGRELSRSADHHVERNEMRGAAADLLTIKTYKLGWPSLKPRKTPFPYGGPNASRFSA